ncbi:MAG TPA: response regulator transcription factor [Nitrospiria bacterium]|jgi:DNA-binding response OmpR family regulator
MAKKILIIEDERDLAQLLVHYLEKEGYKTLLATEGPTGLKTAQTENPDLIILDLMLPGMDGLEICRRLRTGAHTRHLPIMILTAKGEETDKVVGLELGADDYMTKPFSPKELVARVRALTRRMERQETTPLQFTYQNMVLNVSSHEVKFQGKEVPLTAKEFNLLLELLKGKGRVLTRDILLNNIWGYDYYGTTRTVDVHIRRLREKIPILAKAILTVKPYGYKLKEEEPTI